MSKVRQVWFTVAGATVTEVEEKAAVQAAVVAEGRPHRVVLGTLNPESVRNDGTVMTWGADVEVLFDLGGVDAGIPRRPASHSVGDIRAFNNVGGGQITP